MTLKVNGQEIPEEAVQYELNRLVQFYSAHMSAEQIKEQMDALRKRARDQAVGAKLLMDQAQKLEAPVPAELIDKKLGAIVESSGGRQKLDETLARQGISDEMLRLSVERGCRVDMLVEQVTAEVSEPSEEEMRAHFEAHSGEYVREPRAQAQHILVNRLRTATRIARPPAPNCWKSARRSPRGPISATWPPLTPSAPAVNVPPAAWAGSARA